MAEQNKKIAVWVVAIVSAVILAGAIIWRVAIYKPARQIQIEHQHQPSSFESFSESPKDANRPTVGLKDIIKAARGWRPAYKPWYGKMAPNFTLTDITGKQHKLSDYRGKNVLIVLWATWCYPCIIEVPHLIALRSIFGEDKLAILAIAYITPRNTTEMVKKFVERNERINYTIFSADIRAMPAPYNQVMSIPCSFFIDSEGKIKLATEGSLTLGSMKAILQAE